MRVTPKAPTRTCAVCERTLLTGERPIRFAPDSGGLVDVCQLCADTAVEWGWLKEGSPSTPSVPEAPRRRKNPLAGLLDIRGRQPETQPVAADPILRRLSEPELAMVEAAELFNASQARRTVGGIAKSLGQPQASILPLSGVTGEVVVTVAWDISWYQYRVTPGSAQPVRLEERGLELEDLDGTFARWNAHVEQDGRVVPEIARV